jgi:phosphomannomutase/phosphoglucomutase
MEEGRYVSGAGERREETVTEAYENHLFENVRIREGLSIVVDGGNGTGGQFSLPLFRRFGCRVKDIYCDPDGRFPNHFPDPTIPENLKDLISLVKAEKADIGIAFDGDADRLGVVSDDGSILWGDELLLIFARYILKESPPPSAAR